MEWMVQTIKQIMIKNAENAWLALLIFRSTDIPGINKSPSEMLSRCKFRTNIPMVDVHQKSNESEIERLMEKRQSLPQTGKELSKIPVRNRVLYEKNPDASKVKRPKWCKGTVSNRQNPRKYEILTDNDCIVTRSRHHIKNYFTHSGRVVRAPNRLIES